ncbi:MAG: helix-turn-helix domain-containing protein, partial [Chloroflexi bacterium]|nr:helix-turn-helix domain-containing protein [Chloroflexota bacterium]
MRQRFGSLVSRRAPDAEAVRSASPAATQPLSGRSGIPVSGHPGWATTAVRTGGPFGAGGASPAGGAAALGERRGDRRDLCRGWLQPGSLYRWRDRHRAEGLAGLFNRYRAGGRRELPEVIEQLIISVRLLSYWNSRRLAAEFSRRQIWPLSHGQVDRLLSRYGTHRPSLVRQPGPRYERSAPNELWHIDMKGPFYFAGTHRRGSCHFVGLVDDHSRQRPCSRRSKPTTRATGARPIAPSSRSAPWAPTSSRSAGGRPARPPSP